MIKKKRVIMQKNSIYRKIMLPLLIVLLVETTLLIGIPIFGGMTDMLRENAEDILSQQVENRKNYLEGKMMNNWSDLNRLRAIINEKTQERLDDGSIILEELQSDSVMSSLLLQDISDELIAELYAKRVNGIYVMFNTRDLAPLRVAGEMPKCTGLYICDFNPDATPAVRNQDLVLVRAPITYMRASDIATAYDWRPMYTFDKDENPENYDFLYQPFQAAYEAKSIENPANYGYWSAANSSWLGSRSQSITYSVPLVLKDGTVYGVLGIELFKQYLYSQLPYQELALDNDGVYILAEVKPEEEDFVLEPVMLVSSDHMYKDDLAGVKLKSTGDGVGSYCAVIQGEEYYLESTEISLNNLNTPFEQKELVLLGAVRKNVLYASVYRTEFLTGIALVFMTIFGIGGSIFISRRLSQPIRHLVEEVQTSREENNGIPQLSRTEIAEIDDFAIAITELSSDLVNASSRIANILAMTSVEIAMFEVREHDNVFVTENFFPLFEIEVNDVEMLSIEEFVQLLAQIRKNPIYMKRSEESLIYKVKGDLNAEREHVRYVQLTINTHADGLTGLAEDVTQSVLERKRIEYERDYDLLTGLINRRAFYREAERLFYKAEALGYAAIIMLDLDNLKEINDQFGHEMGDQYIYQTIRGFKSVLPENALLARLSGDEFVLLLSGYESREAIAAEIQQIVEQTKENVFISPNGKQTPIGYSGGAALYPEDSNELKELIKYADFAMYQIKRARKGTIGWFDSKVYQEENHIMQSRRELVQLLTERNLQYYFQPIYSAGTGEVFAYEALMRVNMPTLHSPEHVLKLAKQENRLHEIECLSMMKAVESYQVLRQIQAVDEQAYLFINSIANECLTPEEQHEFAEISKDIAARIVLEVTEGNEVGAEALQVKRNMEGYSGLLALDDYGSGYNSEKNLLELAPKFVKVDMSIIRDIDTNADKQLIVRNLVEYAHQRDMLVIAEGIETLAEMHKVLALDVDLLQGYVLARPNAIPLEISSSAKDMIMNFK